MAKAASDALHDDHFKQNSSSLQTAAEPRMCVGVC